MIKAPILADEKRRLETLRSLNLLDTEPEERFDRITRIAKRHYNVPVALVSIIDEKRQWFKSCYGLDVLETPRDISFCGHAIEGDELMYVSNALADKRFHDNPLVTGGPEIRFYAGVPIRASNGQKMGTLCVIDIRVRDFSDEDLDLLRDLALCVEAELKRSQLLKLESEARKMAEVAAQANRAKSLFLSNMSHELRTPLNSILGFAQLLKFSQRSELDTRQLMHVDQIQEAGEYLLDLINDMLDLEKIESGKIALSLCGFHLHSLFSDCLSYLDEKVAEKQICLQTIGFDADETLFGDPVRTKQIVLNLLSNAVKYNRDGGAITVICEKLDDELIRFCVEDTGRGIPKAKQKDLFKPFNRLGAEASNIEGTGIGLALVERLTRAMGGRLGFKSVEGKGSTFWVDLPLMRKGEHEGDNLIISPLSEQGKAAQDKQYLVLYIEDNPANLMLMEELMADLHNIDMISSHSAEGGIDLAKERKPDMILLDINLPGMDGFAAMEILKSEPSTRDIPVIAISADAMAETIRKSTDHGFSDYLTKPIQVQTLYGALNHHLANH